MIDVNRVRNFMISLVRFETADRYASWIEVSMSRNPSSRSLIAHQVIVHVAEQQRVLRRDQRELAAAEPQQHLALLGRPAPQLQDVALDREQRTRCGRCAAARTPRPRASRCALSMLSSTDLEPVDLAVQDGVQHRGRALPQRDPGPRHLLHHRRDAARGAAWWVTRKLAPRNASSSTVSALSALAPAVRPCVMM